MKRCLILLLVVLTAFNGGEKKTRVWLIGDSTMALKDPKAFPETGWGMPFSYFFDSTVVVENHAKNGRSTKSFRAEGLWKKVYEGIAEGDYVFIQFGHNDAGKQKGERYAPPEAFRANLEQYVAESKERKGIPVLITPVARRRFDEGGKVQESHPVYADIVKEVAAATGTPLIDLNERSKALLQQFGKEDSKWLYLHLEAGEHPNYPEGKKDDTHFSELGARRMACIVLDEIRRLQLGLEQHITPPFKK